jgi:hypothetical protein
MRYLVIVQRDVSYGEIFCPDELAEAGVEADPEEVHHQEVSKVIACETTRDVAKAVRENPGWSVWEVTPRGIQSRAILQKRDGDHVYDVEVC